jgi:hypothetical protein
MFVNGCAFCDCKLFAWRHAICWMVLVALFEAARVYTPRCSGASGEVSISTADMVSFVMSTVLKHRNDAEFAKVAMPASRHNAHGDDADTGSYHGGFEDDPGCFGSHPESTASSDSTPTALPGTAAALRCTARYLEHYGDPTELTGSRAAQVLAIQSFHDQFSQMFHNPDDKGNLDKQLANVIMHAYSLMTTRGKEEYLHGTSCDVSDSCCFCSWALYFWFMQADSRSALCHTMYRYTVVRQMLLQRNSQVGYVIICCLYTRFHQAVRLMCACSSSVFCAQRVIVLPLHRHFVRLLEAR